MQCTSEILISNTVTIYSSHFSHCRIWIYFVSKQLFCCRISAIMLCNLSLLLRCGGIFKTDFIANLLIYQCKYFENQLAFGEVTDKSLVSWFFLVHSLDCTGIDDRLPWKGTVYECFKFWEITADADIFVNGTWQTQLQWKTKRKKEAYKMPSVSMALSDDLFDAFLNSIPWEI